jgi:hypothetical protein
MIINKNKKVVKTPLLIKAIFGGEGILLVLGRIPFLVIYD